MFDVCVVVFSIWDGKSDIKIGVGEYIEMYYVSFEGGLVVVDGLLLGGGDGVVLVIGKVIG